MQGLFIPFFTILVAELFDKSQLTVLLLSSKTKKHLELLLGVFLAFCLVDGLAIVFGAWITSTVPQKLLADISGIIFIIYGLLALRSGKEKAEQHVLSRGAFVTGFFLVFVSEWGDKTQIASAIFATRFQPVLVFIGVTAALFLLSAAAIYLGSALAKKVERKTISRVSGVIFILLGVYFVFS